MNTTIQIISNFSIGAQIPVEISKCYLGKNTFSIECLSATICKQLNTHFINLGIIIIILNIVISWMLWWFVNYGYNKINIPTTKKFGNMDIVFNRLLLDSWIRARLTALSIGYIAMVVWLSINQGIK